MLALLLLVQTGLARIALARLLLACRGARGMRMRQGLSQELSLPGLLLRVQPVAVILCHWHPRSPPTVDTGYSG